MTETRVTRSTLEIGPTDPATVLIVDDDRGIVDGISEFLREEGFRVVATANGAEALARLGAGLRANVILLDNLSTPQIREAVRRIGGRAQIEISGGVTLVARHGKIAHFEATGATDIESKKPMAKDTVFRLASMSKPVTAVAVMPVALFLSVTVAPGTTAPDESLTAPSTVDVSNCA